VGLIGWNDLVPTLLLYAATATALIWPTIAPLAAAIGLCLFASYVALRAWRPAPLNGWLGWLARDWAPNSPRFCRWLTGDFVT
jgi:hypothetical protein